MATEDGHEGRWVTMNGNHVFIRSNETIETALARDIKGGKEHGTRKEKQTKSKKEHYGDKPDRIKKDSESLDNTPQGKLRAQADHKKEYERRKKEFYDKADPGGKLKGQMKGEMKKQPNDTAVKAKALWESKSDEAKKNIYASVTGVKPEHVDLGGMSYNMLPKYVKKTMEDQVADPSLGPSKSNDAPSHPAQDQFHKYLKDSAFSKDFEEFNKKPHGPTPSGMGYHKEDLHSHLGRAQMILNYLHKNPKKTFDPFSSLPDQITSQIHPNEFESSMSLLINSDVARGSGLGVKLDNKFKPAPKPKASPDSFKSNMQNFMKKQKGSMGKIDTKLNTLKIASMKLATSN